MKTLISTLLLFALFTMDMHAQEFKIVTTVESIVPMGIGRSRIIESTDQIDSEKFTTKRTDGKTSEQKNVKRKKARIDKLNETKLLNFYSLAGINFQNIASNDALISDRLTVLAADGWDLVFVTSGVESDAGETDSNGIFITRYVFRRDAPADMEEE